MRHASLFSGIGAPELAAHWLGWENAFHCEINPFCKQVLKYWFNNSTSYDDITKTDFRKWQGKIDVLTGDSHANRSVWPEREKERKITVTSGLSLNVPYGKSDRLGLLVRMLLASSQWYSPAKRLTWKAYRLRSIRLSRSSLSKQSAKTLKPKDMMSNRWLFRLVPSVRPIDETASGLLPTITASDYKKRGSDSKHTRTTYNSLYSQLVYGTLLPTPQAVDSSIGAVIGQNDQFILTKNGRFRKVNQNGTNGSVGLGRIFHLMNTPTASDWKGGSTRKQTAFQRASLRGEIHADYGTGKTSQLNPLFVEEMMGFPSYWILIPFIKDAAIPIEKSLMQNGVLRL